jgi:3-phosphoshikimate 1-carboxyvinyltransferase
MLPAFGVTVTRESVPNAGIRLEVDGPVTLKSTRVRVPGDFSAAAFFLAAAGATPGACVTVQGVGLNPTRTGLLDVMEQMGIRVERCVTSESAGEPLGNITVNGVEHLRPFDVPAEWLPRLIDEVPAWTLLACAAQGRSALRGASELRFKESDRLAALQEGLRRLGVTADGTPDGLVVEGGSVRGGDVASHGDHRIAMALVLLGLRASGPVRVDDASSIGTSFPEFVAVLQRLGGAAA